MTWHHYLAVQLLMATAILCWPRVWSASSRWRLLRLTAAAFALSFFVDSPFECARVWTFEGSPHADLLGVPLENMLLIASSVPFAVTIYLAARNLHQRSALPKTPES